MEINEGELEKARLPLRISAIIWQNEIPVMSLDNARNILKKADSLLTAYPQHCIVFPEMMFIPKFKSFSNKITALNLLLNEFNERKGYLRYSLFKAGTLKNVWDNEGLYLKDKKKFTSFIKKFHLQMEL